MDITPLGVQSEDARGTQGAGLAPGVVVTQTTPTAGEPRLLAKDSPERNVPVAPREEPVQVFGYLQKQGRRFKGWHQRWFELGGQHMYYYKNNAKRQCLGVIDLSICTQVNQSNVATFGHAFTVVTSERSHILAARTNEDLEKWVDVIKRNMGPRGGPKPGKFTKVKKWDTFKNTFTRHHHTQPTSPPPPIETSSLPGGKRSEVVRNKSFLARFRLRRDRSPVPLDERRVNLRSPDERESSLPPRPLSLKTEDMPEHLRVAVEPPNAVSLPNTPLTKDRKKTNYSPPSQTSNNSSLGPSPTGTPERNLEPEKPLPQSQSSPEAKVSPVTENSPPPKPPRLRKSPPSPKRQEPLAILSSAESPTTKQEPSTPSKEPSLTPIPENKELSTATPEEESTISTPEQQSPVVSKPEPVKLSSPVLSPTRSLTLSPIPEDQVLPEEDEEPLATTQTSVQENQEQLSTTEPSTREKEGESSSVENLTQESEELSNAHPPTPPVPTQENHEHEPPTATGKIPMIREPSDVTLTKTGQNISVRKPDSDSAVLPDILTRPSTWDEVKEVLAHHPETEEELPSYDELPEEEEPWANKDTAMEQLKEFLAVCA